MPVTQAISTANPASIQQEDSRNVEEGTADVSLSPTDGSHARS